MAQEFYSNLYTTEGTIGMEEVLSQILSCVSGDLNTCLNATYTKEEVKEALLQVFPTKAPGMMDSQRIFSAALGFMW